MILINSFSAMEQFYYEEESQQKEIKIDSIFRTFRLWQTKVHLKYLYISFEESKLEYNFETKTISFSELNK